MKIVKRGDKYAIQMGWFSKSYQDLRYPNYWWREGSKFFEDCWSSKDKVIKRWNDLWMIDLPIVRAKDVEQEAEEIRNEMRSLR